MPLIDPFLSSKRRSWQGGEVGAAAGLAVAPCRARLASQDLRQIALLRRRRAVHHSAFLAARMRQTWRRFGAPSPSRKASFSSGVRAWPPNAIGQFDRASRCGRGSSERGVEIRDGNGAHRRTLCALRPMFGQPALNVVSHLVAPRPSRNSACVHRRDRQMGGYRLALRRACPEHYRVDVARRSAAVPRVPPHTRSPRMRACVSARTPVRVPNVRMPALRARCIASRPTQIGTVGRVLDRERTPSTR